MSGGRLITFEGIDGCGKSTQARLLRERLEREKIPCMATREPGGTAAGESIRRVLLQGDHPLSVESEVMLYMAARAELVRQVIRPAMEAGLTVVCDRYVDSSVAYQGYGGGVDPGWIRGLNDFVTGGLMPHITFLLDLSVEEAMHRRGDSADRIEARESAFHMRVRQGYLTLAGDEPARFKLISAAGTVDEQQDVIWASYRDLTSAKQEGERTS